VGNSFPPSPYPPPPPHLATCCDQRGSPSPLHRGSPGRRFGCCYRTSIVLVAIVVLIDVGCVSSTRLVLVSLAPYRRQVPTGGGRPPLCTRGSPCRSPPEALSPNKHDQLAHHAPRAANWTPRPAWTRHSQGLPKHVVSGSGDAGATTVSSPTPMLAPTASPPHSSAPQCVSLASH
jgi:hypothetical protein